MNDIKPISHSSTSCWTCRRRRVKCDRGVPNCQRCLISEEDCQGYSATKPLRWTNGVASRGKLMGKSLPLPATKTHTSLKISLTDPVVQDLSPIDRQYIKYCKWNSVVTFNWLIPLILAQLIGTALLKAHCTSRMIQILSGNLCV